VARVVLCCAGPLAAAQTQPTAKLPLRSAEPVKHYRIVELPLRPLHIGKAGDIVGRSPAHRAATWSREQGLQELPLVEGFTQAQASAQNSAGQVVGFAFTPNPFRSQAFLYQQGKLSLLPGARSKALAIDDSGAVAGESQVEGKKPTRPVLWSGGAVTDLGSCCGGTAVDVNSQGVVIGNVYDERGKYRAFLWNKTEGSKLLPSESEYSAAVAINDDGHILVQEFEKGLFLFAEGAPVRLTSAKARAIDARGLNRADTVVGTFSLHADTDHAFIWNQHNGFHDLNEFIPANAGWNLEVASGINDRGEIIGWGDHGDEEDVGFLLIPE
jgi:uncharacterized membrane protein